MCWSWHLGALDLAPIHLLYHEYGSLDKIEDSKLDYHIYGPKSCNYRPVTLQTRAILMAVAITLIF